MCLTIITKNFKTMKKYTFIMIILLLSNFCMAQEYELVWSDEFDYPGLPDSEKWNYDVGGSGWGNQELQYYTDGRTENARVENGKLIIEARKENYGGNDYTSARLVTKNKGDWLYGRIEVKAKMPAGRGTWPAIWMLPTDWYYGGWPQSGEIDIMEHVGYDEGIVHGTVHTDAYNHTKGTQQGNSYEVPDATSAFHVYSIEWSEDTIEFFVDDDKYFMFANQGTWQKWPFDKRFHLILNIAVGGTWGGAQGVDDNAFPTQMEVDYVRVYQPVKSIEITGNSFVQPNSQQQFSVTEISGAAYNWTVPADAEILSGQGTSEITVQWGETAGDVSVEITGSQTYSATFPVEMTIVPQGSEYMLDDFADNDASNWSDPIDDSNTFTFDESSGDMHISYDIQDAGAMPAVQYTFPDPVDFSNHPSMEIRLKTENDVVVRVDLVDASGVQTNEPPVFSIVPVTGDNQYHTYKYDFTGNWRSNYPNYGATVDASNITNLVMYINYGSFGNDNRQEELWVDYIKMQDLASDVPTNVTEKSACSVYPVPAKHTLTIDLHGFNENDYPLKAYIISATGAVKKQVELSDSKTDIDVSDLPDGFYLLKYRNNQKHKYIKFIIY